MEWVASAENKADVLTRVWRKRLVSAGRAGENDVACDCVHPSMHEIHNQHHYSMDKTLYFMRNKFPKVKQSNIAEMISSCNRCHSIDPALIRWEGS